MDPASPAVARPSSWMMRRASGVLLHPSSLPGGAGIGDLGPAAHRFVDLLADADQSWWQMLPVGPIGPGHSPYQSPSSFAGNPLLVSLEALATDGLLAASEAQPRAPLPEAEVDYPGAAGFKEERLRLAYQRLGAAPKELRADFERFVRQAPEWLREYTLFAAVREARGGEPWWQWPRGLRDREPDALEEARAGGFREAIRYHCFVQFAFDRQWSALADRCRRLGIGLLGDLPIYVARESAEVWSHRDLFDLLDDGTPRAVAGVPPDYFSQDGQLWGNPLYRWDEHARRGYGWWIDRLRVTLSRFDVVRLDHFIGFVNYWSVPTDATSARAGHWEPGPGAALFERVREALGGLPFLAEDLGEVTPPVRELRDALGLPGMRVLPFSFSRDEDDPERYPEYSVAYTGTHDNNTLVGWLRDPPARDDADIMASWERERRRALARVGGDAPDVHVKLLRLLFESPSRVAVAPLQDLLGLGSEARMNRPGTTRGNWEWRCHERDLSPATAALLRAIARDTGRALESRPAPR